MSSLLFQWIKAIFLRISPNSAHASVSQDFHLKPATIYFQSKGHFRGVREVNVFDRLFISFDAHYVDVVWPNLLPNTSSLAPTAWNIRLTTKSRFVITGLSSIALASACIQNVSAFSFSSTSHFFMDAVSFLIYRKGTLKYFFAHSPCLLFILVLDCVNCLHANFLTKYPKHGHQMKWYRCTAPTPRFNLNGLNGELLQFYIHLQILKELC